MTKIYEEIYHGNPIYYVRANTLEDAKNIVRKENKNRSKNNQISITSGKLHKKFVKYNEHLYSDYKFEGKF